MNIKRILFPTDFSECSSAALEFASRLASETGAVLYIVYVDELLDVRIPSIPPVDGGYYYVSPWDENRRELRDRLSKVVPTSANVAFEHSYLTGSPRSEILKFADQQRIDLIVLGSHGRLGFSRLLLGSVAEGVARRAKCPVLVVKKPSNMPEAAGSDVLVGAQHR